MNIKPSSFLLGLLLSSAQAEILTVAHPEQALPPRNTVVWSPLFQAAWDKLNSNFGGPPDRVVPPNPMMAKLDNFHWDSDKVMPEGSWKVWGGPSTADFLKQVNQDASAFIKRAREPFTLLNEQLGSLAMYGILERDIEFSPSFFRSTKAPMQFHASDGKHPVRFFGVKGELSERFDESVRVLSWRPGDRSHAIQINCLGSDDQLILYLPHTNQDFITACHWLRTWRSAPLPNPPLTGAWNDPAIHMNDEIRVPYITLDSTAEFRGQLAAQRYYKNDDTPWIITRAEQVTRFELHEKGARVSARASIETTPFGGPAPSTPRNFIYDRPFFVFLWRDEAEWPYFGAWIGDTSALKAFP